MSVLRIGVVGYSGQKFDIVEATEYLDNLFKILSFTNESSNGERIVIVSGGTSLGIPKIAYELADKYQFRTVGIMCSKGKDYDVYDVDELIIEGSEWGDESQTFLGSIDMLVRVGGGKQTFAEVTQAKDMDIPVLEKDLEAIK